MWINTHRHSIKTSQIGIRFQCMIKKNILIGCFYILSSNAADTLKDYERIQNFSWHQEENSATGFIWEIRSNFYKAALNHNILPEPSLDIQNNSKYSIEMQPMHYVRNSTNRQHIRTPPCNYIQSFQPTEMLLLSHRLKERVHS